MGLLVTDPLLLCERFIFASSDTQGIRADSSAVKSISMAVPSVACGMLIGRGGENVRGIAQKTGVLNRSSMHEAACDCNICLRHALRAWAEKVCGIVHCKTGVIGLECGSACLLSQRCTGKHGV